MKRLLHHLAILDVYVDTLTRGDFVWILSEESGTVVMERTNKGILGKQKDCLNYFLVVIYESFCILHHTLELGMVLVSTNGLKVNERVSSGLEQTTISMSLSSLPSSSAVAMEPCIPDEVSSMWMKDVYLASQFG